MFNEEDKIRWVELAPSLQEYIKRMIKENGPDYYNAHIKDVYNKISDNTNAISKESNERKQADKNLQSSIDANTANISKNKTNLDNEIKNRQNAISSLKSTVDKDLSAVKTNITKISDKIDSKEFVKVKNSADDIQIAYEQKDKEDKKNIHIYVNNTDIPIMAGGGGGGLGAMPDYTKTKSLAEMINYENGLMSYTLPMDVIMTGLIYNAWLDEYNNTIIGSQMHINGQPCPLGTYHNLNNSKFRGEDSTTNGYGLIILRKGDVITFKSYNPHTDLNPKSIPLYEKRSYKTNYNESTYIYITPLTRSITTSVSGPIPDYSQKYSLHTFPNNSGTFTTTSPGDGYLLFYSDAGSLCIDGTLVSWVGQDAVLSGSLGSFDLHDHHNYKSLVPVKRNAKIEVAYQNNYHRRGNDHTELYFVPLANGASTPSANLGLPDYTRGTNVHVTKTLTYKMPYDGCVTLPSNINTTRFVGNGGRIYINGRQASVDIQNFNLMKNDEIKINTTSAYMEEFYNFDIHVFPYR